MEELFYLSVSSTVFPPNVLDEPRAYGSGTEQELRAVAERIHGGPLAWFEAYGGNFCAEPGGAVNRQQ